MPSRRKSERTEVESLKHADKRVNIPSPETSDFMTDEQRTGEEHTYLRYRRDPGLDPQLVWHGKDEADATDLRVLVRPIYINERIHPREIVENVRAFAAEGTYIQPYLFGDFNGLEFEQQVDFYNHLYGWSNRMILGDSLAVMAALSERENLRGQVQMIYVDPPYGIRFNSNWQPSTIKRDVKDGKDVTYEPEQIQAFRDTWQEGIHSYLSYLRDRLRVARELLTESGSIFVQIGDENVHLVRCLLDEVFGSDNAQRVIVVAKTAGLASDLIPSSVDFLLWYAKDKGRCKVNPIFRTKVDDSGEDKVYRNKDENGRVYRIDNLTSVNNNVQSCLYVAEVENRRYTLPSSAQWKTTQNGMLRLYRAQRLSVGQGLYYKRYIDDFPVKPMNNLWSDTGTGGFVEEKWYVVQTNAKIIQRCLLMTTDPGDLVLDPTCGSGTTAYVAEQWGRRWITIDTSRVALTLARTRLMSARFPSYRLHGASLKDGFVYRTVPHITLKSIANNEQIDVIHAKYQPYLDNLREQINALSPEPYEEWEIPRPNPDATPSKIQQLLGEWWDVKRQRQAEIDQSIQERAEVETLYDQPERNSKAVRVSGAFTVESLQPHRALGQSDSAAAINASRFAQDMIEHLRETGVTNTRKGEKITFSTLDPYPGKHIDAVGTFEQAGQTGRVAVSIGPQYGTVSRDMLRSASIEAVKGNPFDMLIVCGFAFEPSVTEATTNYGRLVVQTARINPELLLMGNDLKKNGKTNLFTVFGEPDVEAEDAGDGRIIVRLLGVDVYDPNTGSVRSNSTDEVACWFIDTDYDEINFRVRHAYFTGADRPYEKLKAALKAEINLEAWESLYRTESIPFDRPKSDKIAVKVINHHGDEVMKVYEL